MTLLVAVITAVVLLDCKSFAELRVGWRTALDQVDCLEVDLGRLTRTTRRKLALFTRRI